MMARKLNRKLLKEFIELRLVKKMFLNEINEIFDEKYNITISRTTATSYVKRALKEGIINEGRYEEYKNKTLNEIRYRALKKGVDKKYGGYKKMWELTIGKDQELLIDAGRVGGIQVQLTRPEVKNNLKSGRAGNVYRRSICHYKNITFDSKEERFFSLLIKECGVIDELIPGENFQKKFGKFIVDFFIKDKNLVIEYHPILKNHPRIEYVPQKIWVKQRKKKIKDYFNGKLIAIGSLTQVYKKLPELGINLIWYEFVDIFSKIKKTLNNYNKTPDLEQKLEDDDYCPF